MLDIGAVTRPYPGFRDNGDRYFIDSRGSHHIVAVIDGLGHGVLAAEATDRAMKCLENYGSAPSIEWFYSQCHLQLHGTRGVVAGIAVIDEEENSVEYTGIGNIETIVFQDGKIETLISSQGIIGSGIMPHIHVRRSPFPPGATMIMHSDGISSKFDLHDYYGLVDQSAQFIADVLLRDWGRMNDDATVVVVRREDIDGNGE